jgi:hypothetical protein
VDLARQSGEVPKKDQKQVVFKATAESDGMIMKVDKGQSINGYCFHGRMNRAG